MEQVKTFLIVDDEAPAHEVLKSHINQYFNQNIIINAYNGLEALRILESQKIDILFLDIEMPKLNGIEVLQNIQFKPSTIITTAYTEFAFEAYQNDAIDYLQKPILFARFAKSMLKIQDKMLVTSANTSIELMINKKVIKILLSEIMYVESIGNYVKIFLSTNKYYVYHITLKNLLVLIDNESFVQISKSFIINSKFVKEHNLNQVILENNTILPLGRQYKELFLRII